MNIFMKKPFMILTYIYILSLGFLSAMGLDEEDQGKLRRSSIHSQRHHRVPQLNSSEKLKRHTSAYNSQRYCRTPRVNINNEIYIGGDVINHSKKKPLLPGNANKKNNLEEKRGCDDVVKKIYGSLLSLFSGGMVTLL